MFNDIFKKEHPRISQEFGLNQKIYKQFGLDGHNGIDFACNTGTPLYSVLTGKVI